MDRNNLLQNKNRNNQTDLTFRLERGPGTV